MLYADMYVRNQFLARYQFHWPMPDMLNIPFQERVELRSNFLQVMQDYFINNILPDWQNRCGTITWYLVIESALNNMQETEPVQNILT